MNRNDLNVTPPCLSCGRPAHFECENCSGAYCRKECQINDRSSHNKVCNQNNLLESYHGAEVWEETDLPPCDSTYFSAIIQSIEGVLSDGVVAWVIQEKSLLQLNNMLKINHRLSCSNSLAQPITKLAIDMLVMVPTLNGGYQRAQILHVRDDFAKIRFIDSGEVEWALVTSLRKPTPQMESTKALAFSVKLPMLGKKLEKGDVIRIRIEKNRMWGSSFLATLDSATGIVSLPISNMAAKIEIVNIIDSGRKALVRLLDCDHDCELIVAESEDDENLLREEPTENDYFILAFYGKIWRRAYLLQYSTDTDLPHLVYFFDQGIMGFSRKLRQMPAPMRKVSMRVILITASDPMQKLPEAFVHAFAKKAEMSLHFADITLRHSVGDYTGGNTYTLNVGAEKLCDVVAYAFIGKLETIGIKYWNEAIPEGASVVIKQCITHEKIFITPRWTEKYANWFAKMASKCERLIDADAVDEQILLAYNDNTNQYFRAQVCCRELSGNREFLKVINIDTGDVCRTKRSNLHKPNRFVLGCPVFLQHIQLTYLEQYRKIGHENPALIELQRCRDNGTVFVLNYIQEGTAVLLYATNKSRSLNIELCALLEEEAKIKQRDDDSNVKNKAKVGLKQESLSNDEEADLCYEKSPSSAPTVIEAPSPRLSKGLASQLKIWKLMSSTDDNELNENFCKKMSELEVSKGTPKNIANCTESAADGETSQDVLCKPQPNQIYTIADLNIFHIPEGEKVPLLILDTSSLAEDGTVMAANNTNGIGTKRMSEIMSAVAEYTKNAEHIEGFEPNEGDLCLTVFDRDNNWYRAACLHNDLKSDHLTVKYVDFGNVAKVSKLKLLPLPEHLLFASPSNICRIRGLKKPALEDLQAKNIENSTVECSVFLLPNDDVSVDIMINGMPSEELTLD